MEKNIKILLILFCLLFTSSMHAQVSIGTQDTPEAAALLQIGDETADKGILLPRVKLNSLSDVTVLTDKNNLDKKAGLTGLLVYNVNKDDGMAEGIYEWDGNEWGLLEIHSEKTSTYTKKSVVRVSDSPNSSDTFNGDNTIVSIGRFSFRFSTEKIVQCKMNTAPSEEEIIGFHIARFWDGNGNETDNGKGYTYDSKIASFTQSSYNWQDFYSKPMTGDQRWEVWFPDVVSNKVYNIQFIIYTIPHHYSTYIVLVTEY
jgi:hypothetical protein